MQLAQVSLLSSVMRSCLAFSHITTAALNRPVLFGPLAACINSDEQICRPRYRLLANIPET